MCCPRVPRSRPEPHRGSHASSLVPILIGLIAQEELVINRIGVVNDEANRLSGVELERRGIEARVVDVYSSTSFLCLCR